MGWLAEVSCLSSLPWLGGNWLKMASWLEDPRKPGGGGGVGIPIALRRGGRNRIVLRRLRRGPGDGGLCRLRIADYGSVSTSAHARVRKARWLGFN